MEKQLQKALLGKGIGAVLLMNASLSKQDPNLVYLSGTSPEYGVLLAFPDSQPLLLVPGFEYARLKKTVHARKLNRKTWAAQLKRYLKGRKCIGINKNMVSLNEFKKLQKELPKKRFKDIAKLFSETRRIKEKDEIKKIQHACAIADSIITRCISQLSARQTEQEVVAFLEHETKKAGCSASFPPIVASGKHAGFPHHDPLPKKLLKGFCIIDFGVKYQGYCSDITRTVYIGRPSVQERQEYEEVLDLQKKCISACKENAKTADVYRMALKALGKEFIHGLGHGIGVEIHELPNLTAASKEAFKEGMVFTVEPGIYSKRRGIRIEDDVLIASGRPIVLTKTQKRLVTISR